MSLRVVSLRVVSLFLVSLFLVSLRMFPASIEVVMTITMAVRRPNTSATIKRDSPPHTLPMIPTKRDNINNRAVKLKGEYEHVG